MAKTPQPVRQIDYDAQVASQGVVDTDQNALIATRQIDSIITNPSFDIWQRGIGPFIDTGYTTDRFSIATGRKLQLDRSVDVPTWSPSKYSVELTNTSIVTAPASYTTRLIHRVEGYNIRRLKNSNMTFSFNVKGNFSGQSSISMFNDGEDHSLVNTYNITTDWTRVSIVVPKNDFSAGVWNIENGRGLEIRWNLESSTDLQTATLGQWLNTLALGSTGDYKFNDTVGNKVWISDVALHVGEQPIVFDKLMRDYATELKLCQRYYQSIGGGGVSNGGLGNSYPNKGYFYSFPVVMRSTPIYTIVSGYGASATVNASATAVMFVATATGFNDTAYYRYWAGVTFDAEL